MGQAIAAFGDRWASYVPIAGPTCPVMRIAEALQAVRATVRSIPVVLLATFVRGSADTPSPPAAVEYPLYTHA